MSIPMLAAVPAIILMADSMVEQFKSGNFSLAICRNWSIVIFPTFSLCGSFDPFSTPAALRRRTEAGGVFKIKVKLLSSKTVISTGITKPGLSAVLAL